MSTQYKFSHDTWHDTCKQFIKHILNNEWVIIESLKSNNTYLVHAGYAVPRLIVDTDDSKDNIDSPVYIFYLEIHLCKIYSVPLLCFNVENQYGERCRTNIVKKLINQCHFLANMIACQEHPVNPFDFTMTLQPCDTEDLCYMMRYERCNHDVCLMIKWWSVVAPLVHKGWDMKDHKRCYIGL